MTYREKKDLDILNLRQIYFISKLKFNTKIILIIEKQGQKICPKFKKSAKLKIKYCITDLSFRFHGYFKDRGFLI